MIEIISLLFVCLSILILLFIYLYLKKQFNKQITIRDSQIIALKKTLANLEEKLKKMERRRAFRVELPECSCTFQLISFGDKLLEHLKNKSGKGKIKNISHEGLKLICEFDLPVREQVALLLDFVIEEEEFSLKGKIIRKEELSNGTIIYGIQFMQSMSNQIQRLSKLLHTIEIDRRKK